MRLRSGRQTGAAPVVRRRRVARAVQPRTIQSVARRAARREIRRNTELKRFYRSSTAATTPAALIFNHTIGGTIARGNEIGEREGDEINIKSIHFRLTLINSNVAVAGGTGWFRFLVLKRFQPAGGITQLFKANANTVEGYNYSAAGDVNQITAPINDKRYKVLLDKKMRILPQTFDAMGRYMLLKKFKLRINKKFKYSTNVANDVDIVPNLYVIGFVQWDNSSVATNLNYTLKHWTYFTDS